MMIALSYGLSAGSLLSRVDATQGSDVLGADVLSQRVYRVTAAVVESNPASLPWPF